MNVFLEESHRFMPSMPWPSQNPAVGAWPRVLESSLGRHPPLVTLLSSWTQQLSR